MKKNYNCLIIGNNTRHAFIFHYFCSNVFLAIDRNRSIKNRLTNEIENYHILYTNDNKKLFKYVHRIIEIKKWVKTNDVSIIFTNTKFDLICCKIALLFNKHKPLILCTFHNSLAWENTFKIKLMAFIIKRCSDGCICLASQLYAILNNYIPSNRLLYQPNSIDCSNISCKESYVLLATKPIDIVYVATIYKDKNQIFALQVVLSLICKYNIHMHFIGEITDEVYYQSLIDFINKNNLSSLVTFHGSVKNEDLRSKLLKDFDIYFSPSIKEMSPVNILEAKACGLPIVASHAFGQQDLIEDGIDGLLYEDGNLADASSKIQRIISDVNIRTQLGKNAINSSFVLKTPEIYSKELYNFISKLSNAKKKYKNI